MLTLIVPRHRVAEAKQLPDVPVRGVYYLVKLEFGRPSRIYAGQTVQGAARLDDHLSKKPWWDLAVMFLAPDEEFPMDVVNGLEAKMIRYAKKHAFCKVDNGNEPKPYVSPYSEDLVATMHDELIWRMDILGYCFSGVADDVEHDIEETDEPEQQPQTKSQVHHQPPFNFFEFGIDAGELIEFYDAKAKKAREDIIAEVVDGKHISCDGVVTSISAKAREIMGFKNAPRGTEYWTWNGRRLVDIYQEKYPAPKKQKAGES
ncbi:MAG: GIY-YIG nuclease family protein [Aeriscardovia sp.]|nr:GIY-YIG nuclease family protein [Aeriscardovia sp.]